MTVVESLTKLYQVERQLRGLRSRLEGAQRYFDHQSELASGIEGRRDELQSRKKHTQARMANLETEGQVYDEQLEKFRNDLNSAATNKQYTAVLTELNTAKEARSKIDDKILAELEEIDRIAEELATVEELLAERVKVREIASAQLAERTTEVSDRLSELEEERVTAAADVPPTELALFEELADIFDGEAMATVQEIDRRRREYSCGECNMHLPFEQVATLMSPTGAVVQCTACRRILMLQEEVRGALTPK